MLFKLLNLIVDAKISNNISFRDIFARNNSSVMCLVINPELVHLAGFKPVLLIKLVQQVAAYGKGFVKASQDTWELFEKQEMEPIVDSDITSSICFLTGVCSGSICVIVVAAWTFAVHRSFTATISLLAFLVGYLMVGAPHSTIFMSLLIM